MAASWVEIANAALVDHCGIDPIMSLDETSNGATACKARLSAVVDAVLREHPWNCAIRRARLAAAASPPDFGFAFAYPLPADPWCLRPIEITGLRAGDWEVAGRDILSDAEGPLDVRYIARLTDPQMLDASLAEAIAARLAHAVAYRVTGSAENRERAWQHYDRLLRLARSVDGQESPPAPFRSSFIEARY